MTDTEEEYSSTNTTNAVETADEEEELQVMKALAGHEMVQVIAGEQDNRPVKIIYMTNKQAMAIAKNGNSMDLMIDALCVGGKKKPSLIIDLVHSWGFKESTTLMDKDVFLNKFSKFCAGIQHETAPFKHFEDELRTLAKLDHFMEKIIIPLAERTSAIIIYNAVPRDCALSESLTKMVELKSSKWNGDPPFSAIGALGSVDVLYRNPDLEDATWRKIMKSCKNWKTRDEKVLAKHFEGKQGGTDKRNHDLHWKTKRMIIVEGLDINSGKITKNRAPFSYLMTTLMRHIGNGVPSLAIKTGATVRTRDNDSPRGIDTMSLQMLTERINTGAKVLCIDIRERDTTEGKQLSTIPGADFEAIKLKIENGFKVMQQKHSEGYALCESLDTSMLAYLHHLLNLDKKVLSSNGKPESLDKALKTAKTNSTKSPDAPDYGKYANMFATEFYRNVMTCSKENVFYKNLFDETQSAQIVINTEKNHTLASGSISEEELHVVHKIFGEEIRSTALFVRTLLMCPRFYGVNIWDDNIETTINDIVLAGKRSVASYEGLKLLKDAWDDVDVTTIAAARFKRYCKLSFIVQLILVFSISIFSVAGASWVSDDDTAEMFLKRATLVSSLLLAAVVSVDTLFAPRSNWLHLQYHAVALESIIWKFRMRVGEFKVDENNPDHESSEENLCKALLDWRLQLNTGANIASLTALHGQVSPSAKEKFKSRYLDKPSNDKDELQDDHYSPLDGEEYIKLRVNKIVERYQTKVPKNERIQFYPQIFVIFLGVTIAVFSELGFASTVTILIAFVSACNSWIEFDGKIRKAQLYSNAISACKAQQSEWHRLTTFTVQDKEIMNEFVTKTEDIVMQVMASWSSTISEKTTAEKGAVEAKLLKNKAQEASNV